MASETGYSLDQLKLIRRCDDVHVDLKDAIDSELGGWEVTDPPTIDLAIGAHLEVLTRGSEVVAIARQAPDPEGALYEVAAALALMEKMAPWPLEAIEEIYARWRVSGGTRVDDQSTDEYRRWLVSDAPEADLPRVSLTIAAALAISVALVPPQEADYD